MLQIYHNRIWSYPLVVMVWKVKAFDAAICFGLSIFDRILIAKGICNVATRRLISHQKICTRYRTAYEFDLKGQHFSWEDFT